MIPDPLRRCRVIREPGTTAREGLVRDYVVRTLCAGVTTETGCESIEGM